MRAYLERELPAKIPYLPDCADMIKRIDSKRQCTSLCQKLFEQQGRMSSQTSRIVRHAIDPVVPAATTRTENSFIWFWDGLIGIVLQLVADGWFSRNTNDSTSTGNFRPGFSFYFGEMGVCIFRGEVKASGPIEVPLEELRQKLTWRYDNAPFVFGYAAVAFQVSLVLIKKDSTIKPYGAIVEEIKRYDLSRLYDRLAFLFALLNLITLFRPLVELISPLAVPDYSVILARPGHAVIELAENVVTKTYPVELPSDDIISNLEILHEAMSANSVPNVVSLIKATKPKRRVTLTPVGVCPPPPSEHPRTHEGRARCHKGSCCDPRDQYHAP